MREILLAAVATACTLQQIWERCGCEGPEICVREPGGRRCAPIPADCPDDSCDFGGFSIDDAVPRTCLESVHDLCAPGTEWDQSACDGGSGFPRYAVLDCQRVD